VGSEGSDLLSEVSEVGEDIAKLLNDLESEKKGLEDIRLSTAMFSSLKISDFVTLYFSMTTVGISVIAYEFGYGIQHELKNYN